MSRQGSKKEDMDIPERDRLCIFEAVLEGEDFGAAMAVEDLLEEAGG